MREILSVEQPCVLCEEPLFLTVITRDDETGEEHLSTDDIPHDCLPMRRLLRERVQTNYAKDRTSRIVRGR